MRVMIIMFLLIMGICLPISLWAGVPEMFLVLNNWGNSEPDYFVDNSVNSLDFIKAKDINSQVTVTPPPSWTEIKLNQIVSGLQQPVEIVLLNDNSNRMFVVEKQGRIRQIKNGNLISTAYLQISDRVNSTGNEQGLLGLAFSPNFNQNGELYVYYTNSSGDSVVSRFTAVNPNADTISSSSEQTGDGGDGGDPLNNAQNTNSLLGKILRISVTEKIAGYSIPEDNPWFNRSGVKKEVWAYGLRNPWKFSFDRQTGDLLIADVGQNQWEEVNLMPFESEGGVNYGWRIMEGSYCYNPSSNCQQSGLELPIIEYQHGSSDCSITGGFVYRGSNIPNLKGRYLFADYCSGRIWGSNLDKISESHLLFDADFFISTFGENNQGELYVADYQAGRILEISNI